MASISSDGPALHRLRTARNAWVATVRADGRPHLVPTWFVWDDGRFWIATGATSVKTRNVRERPAVCVSLEDGDDPLVAEGLGAVHEDVFPDHVVEAFVGEYDWRIAPGLDDPDVGRVVLIEVVVSRWLLGRP